MSIENGTLTDHVSHSSRLSVVPVFFGRRQWLTLVPFAPLRLFLAFAGTGLSLFFLLRNLYPVLASAPNVSARLLIVVIAVLHLIMGIALYWGFLLGGAGMLHSGTGGNSGGGDDEGEASGGRGGDMDDPAGDGRRFRF